MNEKDQMDRFYTFWTLKESYMKALGKGLSLGLDSISFEIRDTEILIESGSKPPDFKFKQYDFDSRYKTAVCAKSYSFPDEILVVQLDLLKKGLTAG